MSLFPIQCQCTSFFFCLPLNDRDYVLVGFAFASEIFGRVRPWTLRRSVEDQRLERFAAISFPFFRKRDRAWIGFWVWIVMTMNRWRGSQRLEIKGRGAQLSQTSSHCQGRFRWHHYLEGHIQFHHSFSFAYKMLHWIEHLICFGIKGSLEEFGQRTCDCSRWPRLHFSSPCPR